MDKFLVDSDIIIWFLKGRKKDVCLIKDLSKKGRLFFSVVTITEIRAGLTKEPKKAIIDLKKIFSAVEIDSEIAELAGAFKQKYRCDIADMFIAASAVVKDLFLVTYNKRHFPMPEIRLFGSKLKS